MRPGTVLITQPTHQFFSLALIFNRIEARLHQLKLRQELFSTRLGDERLFSSLTPRLERIRHLLNAGRGHEETGQHNLEGLITMLKDLETDLTLRELLQAQRSLINYLNRQEEVYASLSRRWQQLTNTMLSIDVLALSNPQAATHKREELEKGLKELEGCLQDSTSKAATRVNHLKPLKGLPQAS
jgi:hypothetical protein